MDQFYFVGKPPAPGSGASSPEVFYRYGNYCYAGPLELRPAQALEHLPRMMMEL